MLVVGSLEGTGVHVNLSLKRERRLFKIIKCAPFARGTQGESGKFLARHRKKTLVSGARVCRHRCQMATGTDD